MSSLTGIERSDGSEFLSWLLRTAPQLTLIIGTIEVALRGGDESIRSNLPTLEAADANAMPGASRSGVRADQRPVELSRIILDKYLVKDQMHIRVRGHE